MKKTSNNREILAQYVKRIWSSDCREYSREQYQLRFFADGCPGIMFQQGENPMVINSTKKLATVFLYGQTVLPITLSTTGSHRAVVAVLQPDALEHLFGIPASDLTDTCVDLSSLSVAKESSLAEQMLHAETESAIIQLMEVFLMNLIIQKNALPKSEIRHAIQLIHQSNGNKRIIDIAHELQVSERTLIRHFEQRIGVPPKVYSSICRFQSAVQRLEQGQFDSLSGLAYELGYADQSHFNRWFKCYAGETPLEYLSHLRLAHKSDYRHTPAAV